MMKKSSRSKSAPVTLGVGARTTTVSGRAKRPTPAPGLKEAVCKQLLFASRPLSSRRISANSGLPIEQNCHVSSVLGRLAAKKLVKIEFGSDPEFRTDRLYSATDKAALAEACST